MTEYIYPDVLVSTAWVAEHRNDPNVRIVESDQEVLEHSAVHKPLIDVRSPGEYSGELLHMPDYPQEGALRGGHIPGAAVFPGARLWPRTARSRALMTCKHSTRARPVSRSLTM